MIRICSEVWYRIERRCRIADRVTTQVKNVIRELHIPIPGDHIDV